MSGMAARVASARGNKARTDDPVTDGGRHPIVLAMCGRYSSTLPPELLARVFGTVNELPNFPANYNLAPSQLAPVVRRHPDTGERHLDLLRWGLLPHFATKDPKRPRPINARPRAWRPVGDVPGSLRRRRCLVPAAAFYEWRPSKARRRKQPYAVARADGMPLALAGIWEGWRAPSGEVERSFAIITTDANALDGPDPQPHAGGDRGGRLAGLARARPRAIQRRCCVRPARTCCGFGRSARASMRRGTTMPAWSSRLRVRRECGRSGGGGWTRGDAGVGFLASQR